MCPGVFSLHLSCSAFIELFGLWVFNIHQIWKIWPVSSNSFPVCSSTFWDSATHVRLLGIVPQTTVLAFFFKSFSPLFTLDSFYCCLQDKSIFSSMSNVLLFHSHEFLISDIFICTNFIWWLFISSISMFIVSLSSFESLKT